MLNIDEDTLTIELKEFLWYDYQVKPILEDIQAEVKDFFDEPHEVLGGDFSYEDLQSLINYEPTKEDKLKLLQDIIDKYESYSNYDENVSIFSEGLIRSCVSEFIEGKFGFVWE